MNRVLILVIGLFLVLTVVSCGTDTRTDNGDDDMGNTGTDEDPGNITDTGDTADTGDAGNTGNTGNTGNDEDIVDPIPACTGSDKFCHSHDSLNWSDASSYEMYWDDAVDYCGILGGRLPTISELRTLIQNCQVTETEGNCGIFDECLDTSVCWNNECYGCEYNESAKYSVFQDTNWFWSYSGDPNDLSIAYSVNFSKGSLDPSVKDYWLYYVRCVR